MEVISEPKFDLILKADKELRLYLMIAKKIGEEKVSAVIGYDLDSVLVKAKEKNEGYLIHYYGQNFLIKDLLVKIREEEVITPVTEAKEPSKESFINGLMLIADKFVETENDKKSIKRILNKISK